jgi:hypothetical protein
MKQRKQNKFITVRDLALYVEAGGAVVHSSTREVFYGLRELPANTESLLSVLIPYTQAEMDRDYKRRQKENEKGAEENDLEMENLFDPEF